MTDDYLKRFQQAYLTSYADLVRFVIRRTPSSDQAEDIAAEACTLAWQQVDRMPTDDGQARAWLFGITRNLLLAQYRAQTRGAALTVRIAHQMQERGHPHGPGTESGHEELVATSMDVVQAWQRLNAAQQEVLALVAWEGLSPGSSC